MIYYIKCKGRWSVHGKQTCVDRFEHFGNYGDEELIEHQDKEKALDCKQHWWTGFEDDPKFEQLKDSTEKS